MNNGPFIDTRGIPFSEISKIKVWVPEPGDETQGVLTNLHPEETAKGVVVRVARVTGYPLGFERSEWYGNLTQDEFDQMMRGMGLDTPQVYHADPNR